MASNVPALKTRKPTGAVPWPLILLEGGEKAGKSWACAEFTKDERLGTTYWVDLGEGSADEYAAIPGTRYEVVDHDGTYQDILGQIKAVRAEAQRANAAGEKPVVLVIDSMYAEWEMLKDWVTERARVSKAGKKALAFDPNAEVKPANGLWNDANTRHNRIMYLLMTFPGIVVMTARGKEVAVIGPDGNPVPGKKDYRVEGQKGLGFDASAWVRLSRTEPPIVVGARSVHSGIRPGVDKPQSAPDFTLSWMVFDALKCDPKTATIRDMRELSMDIPEAQEDSYSEFEQRQQQSPQDRQQPRQGGGVNGLGNRIGGGQPQPQQDPAAEKNAADDLEALIDAAEDRDTLLRLYADAAQLAPAYAQDLQAKAAARAKSLGVAQEKTPEPQPEPAGEQTSLPDTAAS
jgi:hypothetical protein